MLPRQHLLLCPFARKLGNVVHLELCQSRMRRIGPKLVGRDDQHVVHLQRVLRNSKCGSDSNGNNTG